MITEYRKISPTLTYLIGASLGWLYANDSQLIAILILIGALIILGGELRQHGWI